MHSTKAFEYMEQAQTDFAHNAFVETQHNAKWGLFYLNEALEWCVFDPERIEYLSGMQEQVVKLVDALEGLVDEDE